MHYTASIKAATLMMIATASYAEILGTTATIRPGNSLIVDIQVRTGPTVAKLLVTYQTAGVDPLVSKITTADPAGPTAITIGRLRADRNYTYTVRAIDDHGGPAGT